MYNGIENHTMDIGGFQNYTRDRVYTFGDYTLDMFVFGRRADLQLVGLQVRVAERSEGEVAVCARLVPSLQRAWPARFTGARPIA